MQQCGGSSYLGGEEGRRKRERERRGRGEGGKEKERNQRTKGDAFLWLGVTGSVYMYMNKD